MENRKNLDANDPVSPEGDLDSRNERIGFFSGTSDEDVLGIMDTYFDFFSLLAEKPSHFFNIQHSILESIWLGRDSASYTREAGDATSETQKKDKRFRSGQWDENPLFKELKDTYLRLEKNLLGSVSEMDGLREPLKQKVEFYMARYLEVFSPANFPITNPEVLKMTLETGGENLIRGAINFLSDWDPLKGNLKLRMVKESAFAVGVDIAVSKGSVIFQNRLMQLIRYAPSTSEVNEIPLLIIPPWINKYYILDLKPENSFVKWAVSNGLTVYVISWVNPKQDLAEIDFDDYGTEGFLEAVNIVASESETGRLNALGYCIGGTLLGAMLGYMASKNDNRVSGATFLTTMLDFNEPGDLGVFVNERNINVIEKRLDDRGFLSGEDMAFVFNLLRARDLVWHFYINNYLLGKDPAPFDILFWNADTTRLPAKMHKSYLKNMYINNLLARPGRLVICNEKIDLGIVTTPVCFVSAVEDHIAPWRSTLQGANLFNGPKHFILTEGGHVAGVVNPPGDKAYSHRVLGQDGDNKVVEKNNTEIHDYSWWLTWLEWMQSRSGKKTMATLQSTSAIEPSPGSYVMVK